MEFDVQMRDWTEWDHDDGRFRVLKPRELLEKCAEFWRSREAPRRVVEIGVWEGGSSVLWFELLKPDKHVAIDSLNRVDSAHFERYVNERGLANRLKTYWGIRQEDEKIIVPILRQEFQEPIGLVIDDASHMYEPTLASCEAIFPLLRSGGLYIIETGNGRALTLNRRRRGRVRSRFPAWCARSSSRWGGRHIRCQD